MRKQGFHFEIRDNTLALANALNDIIIKRFKGDSRDEIEKKVNVRFVYGPKQRVLYDVINAAKSTTLPVVAIDMKGFSHDPTRIFNKNAEFYDNAISKDGCAKYATPTPIKLNYSMTVITKYRTDMEQIISNFVPHSNPYFIISIKVPKAFGLINEQEIRSPVTWDGNFNIEYPDPISNTQKTLFQATTNFTVNGWIFREAEPPAKPIYSIDSLHYIDLYETDEFDKMHIETYPFIEYCQLNGEMQVTQNPDFIPGVSSISEFNIPKTKLKASLNVPRNVITLFGNGLIYEQNKVVLCGNMHALEEIGEVQEFDISKVSTNRTPISLIKKGLIGLDITSDCEYGKSGTVQYIIPENLPEGEYQFIIYNESGLSNKISLTLT